MERSNRFNRTDRFNPATTQKEADSSRIWSCGDPYKYPIPMPKNSNCWKAVLDPHIQNDKVQCDAWRDEVQNLLIFAGLFSAVVTSFTVDSYKNLQPDPNDTIVYLLNKLVETSTNDSTQVTPPMQPFTASSLAIRVNVFWFLSLTLSLISVLVGTVALQWLREHQKYTDYVNSRTTASVFQMRSLGLDAWYINHIFTGLPLLLQGALVLFFIGMVDFLFSLNRTVAAYVASAVTAALLFFIMTTLMPTLQLFVPLSEQRPGAPPTQCPYRSPQSWIFFLLASDVRRILLLISPFIPFTRLGGWIFHSVTFHFFQRNYPAKFGLLRDFKGWIDFDSWWCNIREVRMNLGHVSSADWNVDFYRTFTKSQDNTPTDLEAKILIKSLEKYSMLDDVVFALYHCLDEVSMLKSSTQDELFKRYYMHVAEGLPGEAYWPTQLMAPFTSSSPQMMRELKLVWFLLALGRQGHSKNVEPYIASHLIELKSRITAYTLSPFRHVTDVMMDVEFMDYTAEYIHYTLRKKDGNFLEYQTYGEIVFRYPVSNDLYEASIDQLYLIYDNFSSSISGIHRENSIDNTTYNNRITVKFLDAIAKLFAHGISASKSDQPINLHPTFDKTLRSISSTLKKAVSDNTQRPFLFLSTCYIVHRMFTPERQPYYKDNRAYVPKPISETMPWVLLTPIHALLDVLLEYNEAFKPYRTSPFSLIQLVCEPIYLWKADCQELVQVAELPEREDVRGTWHKAERSLNNFDTRY